MTALYLHVGGGKTGTTLVQSTCARNRAVLFEAGLSYPEGIGRSEERAVAGEVNSGNAQPVVHLAFPNRAPEDWRDEMLPDWLARLKTNADGRPILLSSEALQFMPSEALRRVDTICSELGFDLKVIFYVRHLLDVALSAYAQFVKSGTLSRLIDRQRSLEGFLSTNMLRWDQRLEDIAGVVGDDRLICRLYDAERSDLVRNFLSNIDPGLADCLPADHGSKVINRTPNVVEHAYFMALNDVARPQLICRAMMNVLLNGPPVVEAPPLHAPAEAFERFSQRNHSAIETINARFLPPETPILMTSGRVPVGPPPEPSAEDVARVAAHASQFLFDKWRRRDAREQAG